MAAGSRRHPTGHPQAGKRVSRHPQLALGAVLDTPGKRIGPNAIHSLTRLVPFGFPTGFLAADRAYTDQQTENFAAPARRLGHRLALDYKHDQRGVQGTQEGALLVDAPSPPHALAHATIGLGDEAVRDLANDPALQNQITQREPYFLKVKESADPRGAVRYQCPAAGPSPSVACPRYNQVHRIPPQKPAVVDLTNPRSTQAHLAAKPTVPIPQAERLRPPPKNELPRICQRPTITVRPGDLGMIDKFRQDRHYLHPTWQDVARPQRANIEGLNGRAKAHGIDISDPSKRLAHGRVAQAILLALMICSVNLAILHSWHQTTGALSVLTGFGPDVTCYDHETPSPIPAGLPPPRTRMIQTNT